MENHALTNLTHMNSYFEVNDRNIRNREIIVIVPEILPPFVSF
jgi:hypothetical protein